MNSITVKKFDTQCSHVKFLEQIRSTLERINNNTIKNEFRN